MEKSWANAWRVWRFGWQADPLVGPLFRSGPARLGPNGADVAGHDPQGFEKDLVIESRRAPDDEPIDGYGGKSAGFRLEKTMGLW
jgi:hypothetical protein